MSNVMLSVEMKNAIREVLADLCADSNEIKVSRYEIFKMARERIDEQVNYKHVKYDVMSIFMDFLKENDYTYHARYVKSENDRFIEYTIITEKYECEDVSLEVQSRGRVTIPGETVRALGYKRGDVVDVMLCGMNENDELSYFIGNVDEEIFDEYYEIKSFEVTVDHADRIRFSIGNNILTPMMMANNDFIQIY